VKEIGWGNMRLEDKNATGVLLTSNGFSSSLFSLCIMLRGGSSTCNIGSTVTQTLLTHPPHLAHQSYPPNQRITTCAPIYMYMQPPATPPTLYMYPNHRITYQPTPSTHPLHPIYTPTHHPPTHSPIHPPTCNPINLTCTCTPHTA